MTFLYSTKKKLNIVDIFALLFVIYSHLKKKINSFHCFSSAYFIFIFSAWYDVKVMRVMGLWVDHGVLLCTLRLKGKGIGNVNKKENRKRSKNEKLLNYSRKKGEELLNIWAKCRTKDTRACIVWDAWESWLYFSRDANEKKKFLNVDVLDN